MEKVFIMVPLVTPSGNGGTNGMITPALIPGGAQQWMCALVVAATRPEKLRLTSSVFATSSSPSVADPEQGGERAETPHRNLLDGRARWISSAREAPGGRLGPLRRRRARARCRRPSLEVAAVPGFSQADPRPAACAASSPSRTRASA